MTHLPDELVQAIAGGNAVLFVGAGLSRGAGLPGWTELLEPLLDEIDLPAGRRGDLLQAAQDYENARGRDALLAHVCRETDVSDREPTGNHRLLLELGIDTWIPTNYDGLLEKTFERTDLRRRYSLDRALGRPKTSVQTRLARCDGKRPRVRL
jgi:hypothetical protein